MPKPSRNEILSPAKPRKGAPHAFVLEASRDPRIGKAAKPRTSRDALLLERARTKP